MHISALTQIVRGLLVLAGHTGALVPRRGHTEPLAVDGADQGLHGPPPRPLGRRGLRLRSPGQKIPHDFLVVFEIGLEDDPNVVGGRRGRVDPSARGADHRTRPGDGDRASATIQRERSYGGHT